MLHKYHVIYGVQYYPRFYVTMVVLGTYYLWIREHYHICVVNLTLCASNGSVYPFNASLVSPYGH
jgi:hypothetical protein